MCLKKNTDTDAFLKHSDAAVIRIVDPPGKVNPITN